jgi:hypothetical protein
LDSSSTNTTTTSGGVGGEDGLGATSLSLPSDKEGTSFNWLILLLRCCRASDGSEGLGEIMGDKGVDFKSRMGNWDDNTEGRLRSFGVVAVEDCWKSAALELTEEVAPVEGLLPDTLWAGIASSLAVLFSAEC